MNLDGSPDEFKDRILWKDTTGSWCSRLFPMLIIVLCIASLFSISQRIVSLGYLPGDDALRHAGLSVTEKTLEQVMVSDAPIADTHPGWHSLLRTVHAFGVETTDDLVVFQVVLLFLLFILPPLFLFKRAETWILTLLLSYSLLGFGTRLLFGRPFIASMAVLLVMLLLRVRLNEKKIPWVTYILLGIAMMISIWWRMTWFTYLFPIVTFAAARMWRAFGRLLVVLICAVIGAGIFAGNLMAPVETLEAVLHVMGSGDGVTDLVGELQPLTYFSSVIIPTFLILISTRLRGGDVKKRLDSPVFFILAGSCFLASMANRWFAEFGAVAFLVLLGEEIDAWIEEKRWSWFGWYTFSRLVIVTAAVALLYAGYTADEGGRWSSAVKREYVDIEDPDLQEGLPGEGGIIYSTSMSIFYQTFFKHPHASWRYMLGCEAAVMPKEDLAIYRNIQWNKGALVTFSPWVKKMRAEDRLWIPAPMGSAKPKIEELEWIRLTSYIWSGRLKQAAAAPSDG